MPTRSSPPPLSLPRNWPKLVRSGVLHAVSLAQAAVTLSWSRAVERGSPHRQRAEIDRLRAELTHLKEEMAIKDSRWGRHSPRRRPHYGPVFRMRILRLRAARGWTVAQTAERFLVTENTIDNWMRRLDDDGETALVRLEEPVNKLPDFVAHLVRQPATQLNDPQVPMYDSSDDFLVSEDGSSVAFVGPAGLSSVPTDGSTAPTQIGGVVRGYYEITTDSTRVVYRSDEDQDGLGDLHSVPIDGSDGPVLLSVAGHGSHVGASARIRAGSDLVVFSQGPDLFSTSIDGSSTPTPLIGPLNGYTYDPVLNTPISATDPLGRTWTNTIGHHELDYEDVLELDLVKGWYILPVAPQDPGLWGPADRNQDGVVGGSFEVILQVQPDTVIESASGPGLPSTETPVDTWQYNGFGQPILHKDPGSRQIQFEYVAGLMSSVTVDPSGLSLTTEYSYDSAGRVSLQIAPDQHHLYYRYDANDNLIEEWFGPPHSTWPPAVSARIKERRFYDLAGRFAGSVTGIKNKSGQPYTAGHNPELLFRARYNGAGQLVSREKSVYDEEGSLLLTGTWTYEYDGRDRLARILSPRGGETLATYDSRGHLYSVERRMSAGPLGEWQLHYDDYGNRSRIVAPLGSQGGANDEHQMQYDGYDRLVGHTTPDQLHVTRILDDAGRVVSETTSSMGVTVANKTTAFDALDRVIETQTSHYALDGTSATLLPDSPVIVESGWGLSPDELLWKNIDPSGANRIVRYEYDDAGRLLSELQGAGDERAVFYTYTQGSLISSETTRLDGRGATGPVSPSEVTTSYVYNEFRFLKTIVKPSGAQVTQTYTTNGWLKGRIDEDGSRIDYSYDSEGGILQLVETGWDGLTRTTSNAYDIDGNRVTRVDPLSRQTHFEYDPHSRLTARVFPDQSREEFQYDDLDRLTAVLLPGGISRQYGHDTSGRVVSVAATGADASVNRSISYDQLGNVLAVSEQVGSRPSVSVSRTSSSQGHLLTESVNAPSWSHSISAGYDSLGSLVSLTYPSGTQFTAEYDDLGRRSKPVRLRARQPLPVAGSIRARQ